MLKESVFRCFNIIDSSIVKSCGWSLVQRTNMRQIQPNVLVYYCQKVFVGS